MANAWPATSRVPAQSIGMADKIGEIRSGYWADLVMFDPDTVVDRATYDDPKQEPDGIGLVVVNGRVALRAGLHTGVGSGQMLRYRQ